MEPTAQKKRPTGMTILLVLSTINACWNIVSSLVLYLTAPTMAEMAKNGQLEELMTPFSATMGEEMQQAMTASINLLTSIEPRYWLFLCLLFIASLMGVLRMFRGDKRGFHIYSISQILMLINASVYLYPKQPQSGFMSELLLTLIFILLYYLYFKRMDLQNKQPNDNVE